MEAASADHHGRLESGRRKERNVDTDITNTDQSQTQISGEVSSIRWHLFSAVRGLRVSSRRTLSSAHSLRLRNLARMLEQTIDPISVIVERANPEGRP